MAPTAPGAGLGSGLFAYGGGFLTVAALMFILDIDVGMAAGISLVPIALFAGTVGARHLTAGQADVFITAGFLAAGMVTALAGLALARRLPRARLGQALSAALVYIGAYLMLR